MVHNCNKHAALAVYFLPSLGLGCAKTGNQCIERAGRECSLPHGDPAGPRPGPLVLAVISTQSHMLSVTACRDIPRQDTAWSLAENQNLPVYQIECFHGGQLQGGWSLLIFLYFYIMFLWCPFAIPRVVFECYGWVFSLCSQDIEL